MGNCEEDFQCPPAPPYLTRELVIASYYLSGVRAKDAQLVTGGDIEQGLKLLNRLLNLKQAQTDLIPYFQYNTCYFTENSKETYFIFNCANIQSVTFNYDTVRFPLRRSSANQYLAGARPNNISSLPQTYFTYRANGGTVLKLYFKPMSRWRLNIYGKFFLLNVDLDTNLSEMYDGSYIEYLHWALAEYICFEFGIQFGEEKLTTKRKVEDILKYQAAPDPTVSKISNLQKPLSAGWAYFNYFRGFVP